MHKTALTRTTRTGVLSLRSLPAPSCTATEREMGDLDVVTLVLPCVALHIKTGGSINALPNDFGKWAPIRVMTSAAARRGELDVFLFAQWVNTQGNGLLNEYTCIDIRRNYRSCYFFVLCWRCSPIPSPLPFELIERTLFWAFSPSNYRQVL